MAQTPQNNNQQSLIDYAIDYLKTKNLRYQESYSQFYKEGHEQECKIRLGNNGHFIDFYMQSKSSNKAIIQNWEKFLRAVDKEEPEEWEIVSGKNMKKSQLIRKDNHQPTTKDEVQKMCNIFYGLFQRYEDFNKRQKMKS